MKQIAPDDHINVMHGNDTQSEYLAAIAFE